MIEKMIHKRLDPVADALNEAHWALRRGADDCWYCRIVRAPSAYAQSLSQTQRQTTLAIGMREKRSSVSTSFLTSTSSPTHSSDGRRRDDESDRGSGDPAIEIEHGEQSGTNTRIFLIAHSVCPRRPSCAAPMRPKP
jgi:hypothetical protein